MAEERKSSAKKDEDKDTAAEKRATEEKRGTGRRVERAEPKVPQTAAEADELREESAARARRTTVIDDGTPTKTEDGGSVNRAIQVSEAIPDPEAHRDRLRDQDDASSSAGMRALGDEVEDGEVDPRKMTYQLGHLGLEGDTLSVMAFPSRRAVEAAEKSSPNYETRKALAEEDQNQKRGGSRRGDSRKSDSDDKK